ncbi:hypothetical protein MNEG_5201 [Monoraphidium neglectum]|uniref:Protein kinase domain-containing protein n=1 Tax=Monoraphidium neglectum TaxID=145388 RepID=A0A0D2NB93_9CHLO|nr:hypothetical protein MNEG_5201 [Monoraphidium neglectum]KIZ02761.1 hypothetical protein MNEG_5201 [Monoraphidium neglectum]|eukprot:XP_013901780.1 hypothetical protein MNEG_5201 [Monoraphidium neglectum]
MEWMAGAGVAKYMRQPTPLNTEIVAIGVDCYMKMLLQDNFVHTDLHPGNIMVMSQPDTHSQQQQQQQGRACDRSSQPTRGGGDGGGTKGEGAAAARERARLVLLDFGLAEELTPEVRYRFLSFLNQIVAGDGATAARHLLRWSRVQGCPDPLAFEGAMAELFRREADVHCKGGIDLDAVLQGVLALARHYEVSIDSAYASLVISVCVITGFAVALDPQVNVMDAAAPALMAYALTGRVFGRLYA